MADHEAAAMEFGEADALSAVFRARYDQIRAIAASAIQHERIDHTLQATAVVHEAWMRIVRSERIDIADPVAFRGLIATVVRHVLVDHARAKNGPRRGEGWRRISLASVAMQSDEGAIDLLDLDEAIEQLRAINPRQARVAELRLFGGFTHEESARRLGVSSATIELDWKLARHWLRSQLDVDGCD